ncbi:MAG: hypothetical protein IT385_19015, partial [Deltaproteobacteria bacterium]|nr:hypothetical protein [Deltaproteobacteria bacterium]
NACTTDSCNPATGCSFSPLVCNDNNVCTADSCDPASGCTHTVIVCTDNNACTTDSCDPATGCAYAPLVCNDGNACTDDGCDPGSGCTTTAKSCDDKSLCTTDSCDPASGCAHTGIACTDNNACTTDSCDPATGCAYAPIVCNDNNVCTADHCDPASGCSHTVIACTDNNACTTDSCDPATGCAYAPLVCNDGDACTDDSCDPGSGCTTTTKSCDDNSLCTIDSCDPVTGCVNLSVCDDGKPCTIDSCDPAVGCSNTPKTCDDGNLCTIDSCDGSGNCVNESNCHDNNPCTVDSCDPLVGCSNTPKDCDDDSVCTIDSCNSVGDCVNAAIPCDDNDACTVDSCDAATGCAHAPYGCSQYEYVAGSVSWFEASLDCQDKGMHLAVVESAEELALFEDAGLAGERYWIGAARPIYEYKLRQIPGYVADDWAWETGEALTFEAWATDEPGDDPATLCLAHELGDGWYALPCAGDPVTGYICEADGEPVIDRDNDGYTYGEGDCDDLSMGIHPGMTEECNGFDDDCDGTVNEGFPGQTGYFYYADVDGDGYGEFELGLSNCSNVTPAGAAPYYGDCAPNDPSVHPGASDTCAGEDKNCNGTVDEPTVKPIYHADADGDGFGNPASWVASCGIPAGYVDDDSDCDDTRPTVSPDAAEVCNGRDDDCSGVIDDDDSCSTYLVANEGLGPYTWFEASVDCGVEGMHLATVGDADEVQVFANFYAEETLVWVGGARQFYEDLYRQIPGYAGEPWAWETGEALDFEDWADGEPIVAPDGPYCMAHEVHGDGWYSLPCDTPLSGYICEDDGDLAADGDGDDATFGEGDCSELTQTISPDATEWCDGFDTNCDGEVDEATAHFYYLDPDGDGFGQFEALQALCEPDYPTEQVAEAYGDCDETDPEVYPGAPERCNGLDDDCDGAIDEGPWYPDGDEDGDGAAGSTATTCVVGGAPVASIASDCADGDAAIGRFEDERCNGLDDDCDTEIDEASALDATTYYLDADGDGVGVRTDAVKSCTPLAGRTTATHDCDDANVLFTFWVSYTDADGDGFGDLASPIQVCDLNDVLSGDDCDDTSASVRPGVPEVCFNLIDDDCDGLVDSSPFGCVY